MFTINLFLELQNHMSSCLFKFPCGCPMAASNSIHLKRVPDSPLTSQFPPQLPHLRNCRAILLVHLKTYPSPLTPRSLSLKSVNLSALPSKPTRNSTPSHHPCCSLVEATISLIWPPSRSPCFLLPLSSFGSIHHSSQSDPIQM